MKEIELDRKCWRERQEQMLKIRKKNGEKQRNFVG